MTDTNTIKELLSARVDALKEELLTAIKNFDYKLETSGKFTEKQFDMVYEFHKDLCTKVEKLNAAVNAHNRMQAMLSGIVGFVIAMTPFIIYFMPRLLSK